MATPKEVRTGLYDRLATIQGLRQFDGQINTPCALVLLADDGIDYLQVLGGGAETWNMLVRVYVSPSITRISQQALDEYLALDGPKSVLSAIHADPTLGNKVSDLAVNTGKEVFVQDDSNTVYLAAEFAVTVLD